jgi:hypothetical protein
VGELVARGVAAEIVAIVEHQNTRGRHRTTIIPRCGEPADAAANHDEIVALLDRRIAGVKIDAVARECMRDLERAVMLAPHTGERRRIVRRSRGQLRGRRQPGRNRQGYAVEKIATGNAVHGAR